MTIRTVEKVVSAFCKVLAEQKSDWDLYLKSFKYEFLVEKQKGNRVK